MARFKCKSAYDCEQLDRNCRRNSGVEPLDLPGVVQRLSRDQRNRSCNRNAPSAQNSISSGTNPEAAPERRARRVRSLGRPSPSRLRPSVPRARTGAATAAEAQAPSRRLQAAAGVIGVGLRALLALGHARAPGSGGAAISSAARRPPCPRASISCPLAGRSWCRRRRRPASISFSSTMRTLGSPSASTVASAMALGSFGSLRLGLGQPALRDAQRGRRPRKCRSGPCSHSPCRPRAPAPPLMHGPRYRLHVDRNEQGWARGQRMSTGLMQGKRGLIMGLANDKSIAWGIAKALADAGRGAGLLLSGRGAEEAGRAAGGLDRA